MTDTLPNVALPTRQAHKPSQAQLDGLECMSCDIPFSGDADKVKLERVEGYRCGDAPACGKRRADKYAELRAALKATAAPKDGHDVGETP